ncbi:MAG TPA: hypothetical protein VFK26_12950 [Gemmatimonadaceae bacterium]|nr:hypothetical protein [Gemmatimonadaceae bacterium]
MRSERIAVTLFSALAAALFGYVAVVIGSYAAWALVRVGHQPLGVALFLLMLFPGTALLFLYTLGTVLTADKLRFTWFLIAFTVYAGIFGGAAWSLWLHGDPARIVPW